MIIQYSNMFLYIIGVIILFLLGRFLLLPMRILAKFVYNALIGSIVIILINFVGGLVGFHIALNIITALVAGFLGLPGVGLLVILKLVF